VLKSPKVQPIACSADPDVAELEMFLQELPGWMAPVARKARVNAAAV
jgi:hypothetical protein